MKIFPAHLKCNRSKMRITRRREGSSKPHPPFLEIIIMRSFARKITDYAAGSPRVYVIQVRQVHRRCPPTIGDDIVVTVMSLSLLLLSSPRASKMLFSHNTPATIRRYGEEDEAEDWTCISGLSRPDGKRYTHPPPHVNTPSQVQRRCSFRVREYCQPALVESCLLYWSFFCRWDGKAGLLFSESAPVLHRVMAILSRSSSSSSSWGSLLLQECDVFRNAPF